MHGVVGRDRELQRLRGTVTRDRLGHVDREYGTEPVRRGGSARPGPSRRPLDRAERNGAAGSPRSRGMDPRDGVSACGTARSCVLVTRDRPRSRLPYAWDRKK